MRSSNLQTANVEHKGSLSVTLNHNSAGRVQSMQHYFFFLGLNLLEALQFLIYRLHLPHFAVLAKSILYLPHLPVHSSGLNITSALLGTDSALTTLSPLI